MSGNTKELKPENPYWDEQLGRLVFLPETTDRLAVSLEGLYYQFAWNSIAESTFEKIAEDGFSIDREEFTYAISDAKPHDNNTKGDEFGLRVGAGNLVLRDIAGTEQTSKIIPLTHQNIPVRESISVKEGQYILFSIDDYITHLTIDLDSSFDTSKLDLWIDRLRFGGLHFDMLKASYADQKGLTSGSHTYPHGEQAFILDPTGMIHQVRVLDE